MRFRSATFAAGLTLGLMSGTAHAGYVSIMDEGTYNAASSDTGSFTYPQTGTFAIDLAGNINTLGTGSTTFSGFPPFDRQKVELTAFNPSAAPGAHFVLASAIFDNFYLSYKVSVDDAEYASIISGNVFTLTPSNSEKVEVFLEYIKQSSQSSDLREFYDFADDPYVITGSLSPRAVLPTVPLPASAPLFGAALLVLGGFGYRLKRKEVGAT